MSCQSESEGSSDGAREGESCEGSTGEEDAVSVEGIRNLVSGFCVRYVVVAGSRRTESKEQMRGKHRIKANIREMNAN
jgi:hypothetical protein